MRRLAWTFAARIGDKYQNRLTRPNYSNSFQMSEFFMVHHSVPPVQGFWRRAEHQWSSSAVIHCLHLKVNQNFYEQGHVFHCRVIIEPCHEIMVLFVRRKLIFETGMRSHAFGLDVWFLVRPFVYFHTLCLQTAKALARLQGCTGSPEPSLVAYVISTIISWAGSI